MGHFISLGDSRFSLIDPRRNRLGGIDSYSSRCRTKTLMGDLVVEPTTPIDSSRMVWPFSLLGPYLGIGHLV